jgi:hypothetical protein
MEIFAERAFNIGLLDSRLATLSGPRA